jgi:hypothetical protein
VSIRNNEHHLRDETAQSETINANASQKSIVIAAKTQVQGI